MTKGWKRWISVLMSVTVFVTSTPTQQMLAADPETDARDIFGQETAETLVTELGEKVEILPASLPDDLKGAENGGTDSFFVIGTGQEAVSERGKYAITVYRMGNTDKEGAVSVKSIDYSALYGKDYTVADNRFETKELEHESTLLEQSAEKENMEAGAAAIDEMLKKNDTYVESADPDASAEVSGADDIGATADIEDNEEFTPTGKAVTATAVLTAPADKEEQLSLAELKQAQTGLPTRETTEDPESEGLMGLADMITENGILNAGDHLEASSVTKLIFEPGETQKQLIFEILEDTESEGDELIQFVLTDPEGDDLVLEPNMSTIVIRDDEPKERSQITFSAASYEASGDAARITLVREGATYNMVTLTLSVSGRNNLENDTMIKEIGFSPYQLENDVDLSFKVGGTTLDYDLSIRDIKGGDAGEITQATLHVDAVADTFLAPAVGGDTGDDGLRSMSDADGDVLEAVGHEAAEDGREISIHDVKYDLVAYPSGQKPAGVYKIMSKANDVYYDRKNPVQVGDYYAAESDYFKSSNMYEFGDSPHKNYKGWNGGGKYMKLEWYSRLSWDEGGNGIKFGIPMRPYAGILLDYTQHSNWDSVRTHFFTSGAYGNSYQFGIKKGLEVKKSQNNSGDNDKDIGSREFMGPIRMIKGEYHEKAGSNSNAGTITDAGKVPTMGSSVMNFEASVGKYAHGLLNPNAHIYGAVCMYKSVKFELAEPAKLTYKRANGTTVSELPARINAPDSHARFYGESITFDMEQNDTDIRVPKGRIKEWKITPKGGNEFTVSRNDVINGRISYISKDFNTFVVNDQFLDALSDNGIEVKSGDMEYTGYRMSVSVKPVFEHIPVHVKVLPTEGKGRFSSSELSKAGEYVFHVGDTINLRGTPENGWYYQGYSMTSYRNYDDTQAYTDAPVVLTPLDFKLSNQESYVIKPVFTRQQNHIEIIMDSEASRYFDIQNLCPQSELPDYLKGKNILKIDDRADKNDPSYVPVAGNAYEIRLLGKKGQDDDAIRPLFTIEHTGQKVNGYVMDIIAESVSERNVVRVELEKVYPAYYKYYELTGRTVYSSAKLRNADGEKSEEPACDVEVKAGGRSRPGYNKDKQETKVLYRSSTVTGADGTFAVTGFEAFPGDTVSVRLDNGDRSQVKYVKLPGKCTVIYKSIVINTGIAASKRSFEVIESDVSQKSMKVVEKKDQTTYVVSVGNLGMPIISPRSPEVTRLVYEYDADSMRDVTKNMVELRPEETIRVRVDVNEKEAGISGVNFILYDKDGKEKEKTEEGGGTQEGKRDASGSSYTATFTADKGLMPGDTLYVQLVGNQYKTVTLTDGSKQRVYTTYPRLNSGLTFGDVIERADPQTFTIRPAVGDYMKDIPFIGNTGGGMLANSGSLTFTKTYVDPEHQDVSPFYLTVGLSLSVQDMKRQKQILDEMRNGKHEDAKQAEEEKFSNSEKVARMDPYAAADENERAALENSLMGKSDEEKTRIRSDWEKGQKDAYRKQLQKQQLSDSLARLDENNGNMKMKKPTWDIKLIVMFSLEFAFDPEENDYYFAGGQYLFGGAFSYKRVWHKIIVCVPCYFAMEHEVSVTWDGQWVTDATRQHYSDIKQSDNLEEQLKTKWPWMTIGYTGKFMPGIGIYGILGARGEITFGISVRFAAEVDSGPSGGLLLSIGGGIAIDLLGLSFKQNIAKYTYRTGVYDPTKSGLELAGEGSPESFDLVPLELSGEEISYMGRKPAGEEELESAGLGLEAPANIEDQKLLIANAAEYARPRVVKAGDKLFMTYLKKDGNGSARLAYSVDTGTGFKNEKYVDESTTTGLDTTSDLLFYKDKIYIAWTHAEKQAVAADPETLGGEEKDGSVRTGNEEETIPVADAKEALQSMNLMFAVYDVKSNKMYGEPIKVTDDEFLNQNVRLSAENGKVLLTFYKKDLEGVEDAEDLLSQRSNYSTWARATYDIEKNGFDMASPFQTASPLQKWEFVQIENPEYYDPLVLDYSSATYTAKSDKDCEWRMSLYTVDEDLNSNGFDARSEGADAVDAQIWLDVRNVKTMKDYPDIKLAEGNVTNARLNVLGDGNVLITWLEDARKLYTISADSLFYIDDEEKTVFEHYVDGDELEVEATENGRTVRETRDYELDATMDIFAEGEGDMVSLSQYSVVSGDDGNIYLFALAPGNEDTLSPSEAGGDEAAADKKDKGQEIWAASYYAGKMNAEGDDLENHRERTGWGGLTQITHYGQIIDEMSIAVDKDHKATILANMYKNVVNENGLTSSDYKLVRLDCKPVTSLAFSEEPHFIEGLGATGTDDSAPYAGELLSAPDEALYSGEISYPTPGYEVSIAFTLTNEGILPAKSYGVYVYRVQGNKKDKIGEEVYNINEVTEGSIFTGEERRFVFHEKIPESIEGLSYSIEVEELDSGESKGYGRKSAILKVEKGSMLEEWTDAKVVSGAELIDSYNKFIRVCDSYGISESGEEPDDKTLDEVLEQLSVKDMENILLVVYYTRTMEDVKEFMNMELSEKGIVSDKWYAAAYLHNAGNVPTGKLKTGVTQIKDDGTRGDVLGESAEADGIEAGDFLALLVPIDISDGTLFNDIGLFKAGFDITVDGNAWGESISLMAYTTENVGISRADGKESLELNVGDTLALDMEAHPFSSRAMLSYVSDDTGIVAVSEDGTLTATGQGECDVWVYDFSTTGSLLGKKIRVKVGHNSEVQYLAGNLISFEGLSDGDTIYMLKGGKYYTGVDISGVSWNVRKAVKYKRNAKTNIGRLTPKKDCVLTLTSADDETKTKAINLRVLTLKKKTVTLNSRRKSATMAEIFTGLEKLLPDAKTNGVEYEIGIKKDKKDILTWSEDAAAGGYKSLDSFAVNATGKKGSATVRAVFAGKVFTAKVKSTGFPVVDFANGDIIQNLPGSDALGNRVLTFDSVKNGDTLLLLKSGKYAIEDGVALEPMGAGYRNAIRVKVKNGVRRLVLKKEAPVKLIKSEVINGVSQTSEKTILINFVNVKKKKLTLKEGGQCTLADLFPGAYELLPDPSGEEAYGGYQVKVNDVNGVLGITDGSFPGLPSGGVITLHDFKLTPTGSRGNATVSATFGGKTFKSKVSYK